MPDPRQHPAVLAIPHLNAVLDPVRLAGRQGAPARLKRRLLVVGMQDLRHGSVPREVHGTEQLFHLPIDISRASAGVVDPHQLIHGFRQRAVPLLALADDVLGPPSLGVRSPPLGRDRPEHQERGRGQANEDLQREETFRNCATRERAVPARGGPDGDRRHDEGCPRSAPLVETDGRPHQQGQQQ
jgi:hypothetical protein